MNRSLLGWLNPLQIFASLVVLFVSLPVHSFAKAYTANKLGDPTADQAGRLTLNPFAHINPWGALALVLFRFGWSNPLPVDSRNLKYPKRDLGIIAAVGPISYFVMGFIFAFFASIVNVFIRSQTGFVFLELLLVIVTINVQLGVINLLPIAPFDGGAILMSLLPINASRKLASFFARHQGVITVVLLIGFYSGLLSIPFTFISQKIVTFYFQFFALFF